MARASTCSTSASIGAAGCRRRCYLEKYDRKPGKPLDFLPSDPYHDKTDVVRQMFYEQPDGYTQRQTPQMKGFVWNNGVPEVMWTYTPDQLPVINGLAREYGVSDAWFSSVPSATNPNRAFAFTGSSLRELNNFQNGPQYLYWPYAPHRSYSGRRCGPTNSPTGRPITQSYG